MDHTDHTEQIKAFAQQLTSLQRQLYLYILTLVPNHADAEDLLQETNRVMWEKMEQFEPGSNFAGWAYKIAFFEVRTYRKKKGRESLQFNDSLVEQLAQGAEEALSNSSDRRRALHACLDKLPSGDRELISRRYLNDTNTRDVAALLGRTEKSIYHALARVRSRLLACIERRLSAEGAV